MSEKMSDMSLAEWANTFEEEHGWSPDLGYEIIKYNKTQEEIYGEESGIHDKDEGWNFEIRNGNGI